MFESVLLNLEGVGREFNVKRSVGSRHWLNGLFLCWLLLGGLLLGWLGWLLLSSSRGYWGGHFLRSGSRSLLLLLRLLRFGRSLLRLLGLFGLKSNWLGSRLV